MLRVTHGSSLSLSPLLPVLVSALPAVLAALALLTLPAAPDALSDLDVVPGVEVVLATRGAVQQVTQLARAQLGNLEKIPINTLYKSEGQMGQGLGVVLIHPVILSLVFD